MDKGYKDNYQYSLWTDRGIFFLSRMKNNAKFESLQEIELPEDRDHEILKDETITVQYTVDKEKHPLKIPRIAYWDQKNQKLLIFLINNLELEAAAVAAIYKHRWQIELLFKKLKQNFPLKYFLGDNQKRDRNPDLVHSDILAADGSDTKAAQNIMGFLQHGSNRQIPPVQLRPLDQFPK